ncbi:MAG: hypothetical protein J6568_03300 [Snodgrassella sp.]|nr:hypothetical protein [Snodgrassella sp.]
MSASSCIGLMTKNSHYFIGMMGDRFRFSSSALIIGVVSAIFLNRAIKPLPHSDAALLAEF